MSHIVGVGIGDKTGVLLACWARSGHTTATGTNELGSADVVLFDSQADDTDLSRFAASLEGKIVIECGNARDLKDLRSRSSIAEDVARSLPGARVIKALNAITAASLDRIVKGPGPEVNDSYPSGYYCGDDAHGKEVVASLLDIANLDPIDCGPLANAALLESLGVLGGYFERKLFGPLFTITVVRRSADRSPLDPVM